MDRVLSELDRINSPADESKTQIYHIWGNHEFYAFKADYLVNSKLNTARFLNQENAQRRNYYSFDVTDKLRVVCLDQFEISVLGLNENDDSFKKARDLLDQYKNKPNQDLKRERSRDWNGAISEIQFEWLKSNLNECKKHNKRVLLSGHVPLMAEAADSSVVWNSI